jgi:DNA polymerase-3 subunit delta
MPGATDTTTALNADTTIALLIGPDLGLRDQHTHALKDALIATHGQLDEFRFDATAEHTDILDECRSFGLMASHKLIVVDDIDQLLTANSRPAFERYAEAPAEGATLVLRGKSSRPGKFEKLIAQSPTGVTIKCDALSFPQAVAKLRDLAKAQNASIDRATAEMLVRRVGTDLGRLANEIAKLATAAGPAGAITPELLHELAGDGFTTDASPWNVLIDPLASGNTHHALGALRHYLDNAPRDSGVPIVMLEAQTAGKIHAVCAASASGVRGGALKKLAGWGPSAERIADIAPHLDPYRTFDLYDDACDADRRSKSGLGKPERTAERLAVRLALALAPRPGTRRR